MAPAAADELVSLEERRGRGRCLVARGAVAAGTRVLSEEPWAWCLSESESGRRCDYSLRAEGRLLRCPTTGLAFASRQEQKAAWAEYYEHEHQAAKSAPSRPALPPVARLAVRALLRGLREKPGCQQQPWSDLESHWEHLNADQRAKLEERAALCVEELRRGSGSGRAAHEGGSVAAVGELLAVLGVNAMVVADEEHRSLGLALYLRAALLNHSEEPNCTQRFAGKQLWIHSLRPIAAGEELTIPYAELAEISNIRRAKLRAQYFFDPLPSGQVPTAVFQRDATLAAVVDAGRDGITSQQVVVAWSEVVGVHEEGSAPSAATQLVKNVHALWAAGCSAMDAGDNKEALGQLRCAWEAASHKHLRLGPGHALRLAVARSGMDAAIAAECWEEAAVFARAVSCASRLVYPAGWPVTGLSLARLAKLELYLCRFCAAEEAAEEAIRILTVTEGDSCEVLVELRQMAAQARAEAFAFDAAHAGRDGGRGGTKQLVDLVDADGGSVQSNGSRAPLNLGALD